MKKSEIKIETVSKRETLNVRSLSMLEKCSEQRCLDIAKEIYNQRMMGFEVGYLEKILAVECSRMFKMTRLFCGRTPELELNDEINNLNK